MIARRKSDPETDLLGLLNPAKPTAEPAEPLYVRVAAGLRTMILTSELKPGTWVRMQAIAQRFGVSVQPVREALQALQGEGLLEIHPNRGAQVRGLDRQRLVHIFEIRAALSAFLTRRFAEEAAPADIRAVEAAQRDMDEAIIAGDQEDIWRHNSRFHAIINGHGGNEEALAIMRRYQDLLWGVRRAVDFGSRNVSRVQLDHHAMIEAFHRHDGAAAAELGLRHTRAALDDILTHLDRIQQARARPTPR